jgi:CheY-specific phosphatase CheX
LATTLMPTEPAEDIAKKFGLETIPDSVRRLNQLIARCDAASTDAFAKLVNQDAELTSRLLRSANPHAETREEYTATTVAEALQRTGMSSVLLLAMSDPLIRAVLKSFGTMLHIELESVLPSLIGLYNETHVLGEVGFTGKATGLVHLRLPMAAVPLLGYRLLGLSAADMQDVGIAHDVIGELCNMIVGNFKSNLCDAGLSCKLTHPEILTTSDFKLRVVDGGTSLRYGFRSPELSFFTDLSVNPYAE